MPDRACGRQSCSALHHSTSVMCGVLRTSAQRHGPARILLAEDDSEMRSALAAAMREDGYSVIEVGDGGRLLIHVVLALRHADKVVDLGVTDIRMPVTTGLRVLQAARDIGNRVPFIVCTAFPDDATRSAAKQLGAVIFEKPFDIDQFRATVQSLLAAGMADGR